MDCPSRAWPVSTASELPLRHHPRSACQQGHSRYVCALNIGHRHPLGVFSRWCHLAGCFETRIWSTSSCHGHNGAHHSTLPPSRGPPHQRLSVRGVHRHSGLPTRQASGGSGTGAQGGCHTSAAGHNSVYAYSAHSAGRSSTFTGPMETVPATTQASLVSILPMDLASCSRQIRVRLYVAPRSSSPFPRDQHSALVYLCANVPTLRRSRDLRALSRLPHHDGWPGLCELFVDTRWPTPSASSDTRRPPLLGLIQPTCSDAKDQKEPASAIRPRR